MKKFTQRLFFVFIALLALNFLGCSSVGKLANSVKEEVVQPAPDAGFIQEPERQTKREDLPFQKVWIKPGFDKSGYTEMYVAPVNTNHMLEMDWVHKLSSATWLSDVKEDTKELAQYFHDQVVQEFNNDPNQRFKMLDCPAQSRQKALILELALIEIDPSQPVLHALSWAGPPGSGSVAGAINKRRAAFEARIRDLKSGEIIATFADRESQEVGPIDLTRLTWYGPAKGIMDRWAKQFVQIANRKPSEVVTDPIPFTLRPF